MEIQTMVRLAKARGASDVHLAAGSYPILRVNGALVRINDVPLTKEEVEEALRQVTTDAERAEFRDALELDFGYTFEGVTRLRCNAAVQRGMVSLSMRLIPTVIPGLEELHLPALCKDLALKPRGVVIVSGPTGSGKSTTLAAMVGYLNSNESRRIVTVEDPIEYLFQSDRCTIIQRGLGGDTHSFADALKHVLRQDPNVIMVGEMRDKETASAALILAETGHLILTTGHAPSASQACERIIDLFPVEERHYAQTRMASLLVAIMCQTLLPTVDGNSRIPAIELMLGNPAVKNIIREGKIHQLPNVIRTSKSEGMRILDESLVELYAQKVITGKTLLSACNDRSEVEKILGEINVNLDTQMQAAEKVEAGAPLASLANGKTNGKPAPVPAAK